MGRPQKEGLDYFPLDTVLDTKFELIEAEFGIKGFAVVVKLLQKIYREHGYYCEWTEEVKLLFSRKINEGCNLVSEIVTAAIKRGIFDKNLFAKYQILTSAGVQKRYLEITSRRLNAEIKKEYLLISDTVNTENVNINSINVNNNSENVSNNPQMKLNKMKLNKMKLKESSIAVTYYLEHINPAPGPAIIDEIDSFMDKGMTEDCIIAILDYCRSEGKTSWSYIRAAIDGNFKDGVLTAEDYYKKREAFKNRKHADKPKSKFHNFEQRKTDFQKLEDEYFDEIRRAEE